MAKKSGTATKPGGIKSWMNHLFTKNNKTKTSNVGVTTKARSIFDSLSEKNTIGSSSAKDSIVRSSSSTTTTTTTTTQSSSNHHHHSKVREAAHPPTATNHDLIPSTENLAVSSVDHDEERAKDEHVDTQEDQQPSADCPAPIEIFWPHGGQDVFVTGTFDNWSKSVRMDKQVDGVFMARLRPSDHSVWYKFVVDGLWKHDDTKPTEKDKDGNTNNVIHA